MGHAQVFQERINDINRPTKAVVFVDMVDSTRMKADHGEVTWLGTLGIFLDIVTEAVEEQGGIVVKYLGDGVLAVFGIDNVADAINASVKVQERLGKANTGGTLKDCYCTIGVATGKVVEYDAPGGGVDYVGNTVDLAARLTSKASPNAIWADAATIASANMAKVVSNLGHLQGRNAQQYTTDEQTIPLKGFSAQVVYREIVWNSHPFGAKSEAITELANKVSAESRERSRIPAAGEESLTGKVINWRLERGQGFLETSEGDVFFTDRRFLADGTHDLQVGDVAKFVKLPPFSESEDAKPVAGCVIEANQTVHGTFKSVRQDGGYGFIDATDERGNHQDLFVYLGNRAAMYREGDEVDVRIAQGNKGLKGELPAMIEEMPEAPQAEVFSHGGFESG